MSENLKNKKKPAIIFISILCAVVVIITIVYVVLYFVSKNNMPKTAGDVFLYEPDYNAQIMTEEQYLIKDRRISYCDGFGTWYIYDENGNYSTSDDVQLFLIEYVNDLVAGDATALKAKYSSELVTKLKLPDRMTQQRIYETKLTELSKKEINQNGEIYFEYEYKIEYKIMRNDGTFRVDLASDSVKGQYFTIEQREENITITKVVEYAVS